MRKSAFVISIIGLCMLLVNPGCNQADFVNGSGNQISQTRTTDPFTKVEVSGSMKIILKQDASQQIRVVADDNIQKFIKTEVNDETLKVELEGNFGNTGPISVYLNAKNFDGVVASGAVEVKSDGNIKTQDFLLDLSGSNKVTLDLNAANVKTKSSGSSEINLKGQASNHDIVMSGSGTIEALDFIVGNYKIETSGDSKSRINVLNELSIHSSGSSDVKYRGNPRIKNDNSGSSSVKKIN